MSNYFRNNINKNILEKKKIYTYYPKFNQKNINFESNQHKIKENNNKYIYLDDPYDNNRSNHLNHPNKINNCNFYNTNSIKYNYNNNIVFKKRKRNQYENINIKNYYFFNSSREENTYDEYIIDYKAGLNNNFYRKKVNLNKIYNNLSLQNWRNKNSENESNRIYNKLTINGNNNNIINKDINKNNTYDGFYHLNNSKGKKKKMNMEAPYKRRIIINDYNFNCNSSNEHNDNASINHINRAKHSLISKKILKRNNTSDIYKENKIFNNRNHINNNLYQRNVYNKENNFIHKKGSFILSKSSKTNKNVSLTKIINFIQHLSKYCSSYYSKIIKQFFESLKTYNNMDKNKNKKKNNFTKINNRNITQVNSNINLTKKSKSPFNHIKKKNVNYGLNRKRNDKINETLISNKSSEVLIDRIKTRNESLSPNSRDFCEMFRNINELNKKYETISVRKNKNNNHSLKKDTIEVSFKSENKSFNDRFSSIERNKEKWENTINTERERKRRILEKKCKKKNNNIKTKTINVDKKEKIEDKNENNISKLIEKSKILKKKIKKLEQKNKKTIEVNWNLDAITIKSKKEKNEKEREKEREREKDFSFGDENKEFFNSSNSNFGNSGSFNIHDLIGSDKFDKNLKKNKNNMINMKKIITKDKRIFINMNYLNYLQNPENKNKKITNCELYKICNEFNIDLFGDKNKVNPNSNKTDKGKSNNNNDEKVKYINKLTQITEEENKVDLSENNSQSSTENIVK